MRGTKRPLLSAVILGAILCLSAHPSTSQTKPRKFKHDGKITSKYDRATDQTTVFLQPYVIKETTNYVIAGVASTAITAGFTHGGHKLQAAPTAVELGILSESRTGYLFEKDRRLLVTVDGEQLDLGEMKLITSRLIQLRGNRYREDLAVRLSLDVFARLIRGKRVQLKVGRENFELKDEHLEALRELASRAET